MTEPTRILLALAALVALIYATIFVIPPCRGTHTLAGVFKIMQCP